MATSKILRVGIIIGSQRVVRVGPQIANFVLETIKSTNENQAIELETVDLRTHNLPIFDEPHIPVQVKSPAGYEHEHTREWSRRISALDAFVFVTPQRNWGMPSELKNAIDYLFHEWKGKPAMIVSYGGHGGHQSADQLRTVLGCIGVQVVDNKIGMAFPDADFRVKCFKGEELELNASSDEGPWAEHRADVSFAWKELLQKLETGARDS